MTIQHTYAEHYVLTNDNESIAFNQYKSGHDAVLVIAHGWFMSKDSNAFKNISKDFSQYYDVIMFDFRGHSKSSGKYTFGSKEIEDLSAIMNYAKVEYKHVYLIGFSLGSLIAVDYCSKYHDVEKLILVSAPVSFNKIENHVWSPKAFIPTLKKFEFSRWVSIRFSGLNQVKINPIDVIQDVSPTPIFFIAGEEDPIIHSWHNNRLFERAKGHKKQLVIKGGKHAEDLYLENKDAFLRICTDWLNSSDFVNIAH